MPLLEASVSIRCRVEDIFNFLIQSENFLKIIPPDLQLVVIRAPQRLTLGSQFEVQISGFGVPQNIVYEITEFEEPHRFTETQIKGPLGRYVQEHVLSEQADGSVLVTDRIDFEPPGGFMKFLISEARLRPSFEKGLEYRHRKLKKRLEEK